MSDSLNSVTLSGNLGQDVEVRYTSSGLAITSFSLAVSTSWVDCVMYGKRGEAMYGNGMLQKGARLAIVGRLHQNVWEKDGQRRSKLEVIVDNVVTMTAQRQQQQGYQAAAPQPQYQATPQPAAYPDVYDEDIPF